MGAVHLGVVELERDRQSPFPQMPSVSAPYYERIVEYPAVHSHCTVNVILDQSGSADDHTVGDVVIRAALRHLLRQT